MTDQAVSDLGSSGALVGTELFYADNGSADVKVTAEQIQAFVEAALTAASVGLGSVTNDAQTKAAIVPNTAPSAGQILVGNSGGTAYAKASMSGDATMTSAGVVTTRALKSKLVALTRDLTASSGSVATTGVGFQPSALLVLCVLTSSYVSLGFADSGKTSRCAMTASSGSGWDYSGTSVARIFSSSGNDQAVTISSYDSDGFTLSWTKTGSPTGTAQVFVLCLR